MSIPKADPQAEFDAGRPRFVATIATTQAAGLVAAHYAVTSRAPGWIAATALCYLLTVAVLHRRRRRASDVQRQRARALDALLDDMAATEFAPGEETRNFYAPLKAATRPRPVRSPRGSLRD